jgi:hypothetical protein
MEERKGLLEEKEALSKRISLELTTLLSLMISANESDYNHLDVAYNALAVARDHLEMIVKDEEPEGDPYAYEKFQGNGDPGELPGNIEKSERERRD